jgi:hypothetical protein
MKKLCFSFYQVDIFRYLISFLLLAIIIGGGGAYLLVLTKSNFLFMYLIALLGSIIAFVLSKKLSKRKVSIDFIGNNIVLKDFYKKKWNKSWNLDKLIRVKYSATRIVDTIELFFHDNEKVILCIDADEKDSVYLDISRCLSKWLLKNRGQTNQHQVKKEVKIPVYILISLLLVIPLVIVYGLFIVVFDYYNGEMYKIRIVSWIAFLVGVEIYLLYVFKHRKD